MCIRDRGTIDHPINPTIKYQFVSDCLVLLLSTPGRSGHGLARSRKWTIGFPTLFPSINSLIVPRCPAMWDKPVDERSISAGEAITGSLLKQNRPQI